jgi:prevent-host-death family protein
MDMVALYDAKNRLSEICNQVSKTGEPCVISRRGKPVVKLVPVEDDRASASVWDTVEESRARYGALDEDFILPQRSELQREDPLD